ncbi:hypothetical protein C2G38_2045569 [Gigaspora rosea]|uniref:Zn(2)-C6 fungal-type domain-containing protein n=1 Tax=Gigaspora rosea TaxID=44941 RepID=A0A397ULG2_9GLOM|nr:hypothetical protein C2G38_2045569 [Gigaspora rosea]
MYQGKNSFIIENNSEKTKPLSRVRAKCACGPCRKSKKKCEGGIPNKKQCLRCEKSRGAKKCVYVIDDQSRDHHPTISNRNRRNRNSNGNRNSAATGQQSDYNAIGVFTSDGAEYNVSDYIEQTLFWQSYPYSMYYN